jgi:hypothetical protein
LVKLRRHLEQFNRLLDSCADADPSESRIANEARISMIDVLGESSITGLKGVTFADF